MKRMLFITILLSGSVLFLFSGGSNEVEAQDIPGGGKLVEASGMSLAWEVSGDEIIFTLQGETTGWVSVGFNPARVMKDAQFVIGYVEDGKGFIRDEFGTGTFSHAPDTELGGSDDVRLISASQEGGITELKFALPIDSGDQYDVPLTPGEEHVVLLARGPDGSNNFTKKHAARARMSVVF
jgi:hypothetical protein